MKTNIKVLKVCQCTIGWMTLKPNSHDMMMVKLVFISTDEFSSSQTFNKLTGIKKKIPLQQLMLFLIIYPTGNFVNHLLVYYA